MQRHGLLRKHSVGARFEAAPGEIGVLAARNRERLLVEAAGPLEQGARIEDIARLVVGTEAVDSQGSRERAFARDLERIGVGPALDDAILAAVERRNPSL